MTKARGAHAVVLGGSIAGLLAARVLSCRYDRVTIIEKDRIARDGSPRPTVPQGAHVHGVLARGLSIMEHLFPGLTTELVTNGASLIAPQDARIFILGWRKPYDSPLRVLSVTRPFLEWKVAARVTALPNVTVREETECIGLELGDGKASGVTLRSGDVSEVIGADFIVDARGRSSNLADWMKLQGFGATPHETSPLSSVYCSCLLEPAPGSQRPLLHQVARMEEKVGALLFPVENNRLLLSIGANTSVKMPANREEMLELLRGLPVPDLYDAVKPLQQISPLHFSRFSASVRRRFDRLARVPARVVAIGDAVASFNPIFGQGMTVAAIEAEWLGKCIDQEDPSQEDFVRSYYAGLAPIIELAWGPPDLEAKRNNPAAQNMPIRLLLWYTERMQKAASRDAIVSRTLAEVQNMMSPPAMLFSPGVAFRVLFG